VEFWVLAKSANDQWFGVFFLENEHGSVEFWLFEQSENTQRFSVFFWGRGCFGFLHKPRAITGLTCSLKDESEEVLVTCRERKQRKIQRAHRNTTEELLISHKKRKQSMRPSVNFT
jgi:hypothetical protein